MSQWVRAEPARGKTPQRQTGAGLRLQGKTDGKAAAKLKKTEQPVIEQPAQAGKNEIRQFVFLLFCFRDAADQDRDVLGCSAVR